MANTVWRATLADAVERLKVAPWVAAAPGVAVEMPLSDPTASFVSDAYDTFKSSGDAAPASGRQAAYVGMAAYRFALPADAFEGTEANVVSLAIQAYADKFNWRGLLVTAYLSDDETPSTDWDALRTGELATPLTPVEGLSRGILYDDAPATKLATNKTAPVELAYDTAAAPKAYLYVIVQHSDWLACKYEYWIEGAGMLVGASAAVTFDRAVPADAPDTTWAYPVALDDIIEPSRVYPLDREPIALNTVLAAGANTDGQATVPAGLTGVVSVAAGDDHSLALKSNGTVVAWGKNVDGQTTVPAGLTGLVSVAGTSRASFAAKSDGTVVAWGNDDYSMKTTAAGWTGVRELRGTTWSIAAIKTDGTVLVTGYAGSDVNDVPAGLTGVVDLAIGHAHALALVSDGTITGWGSDVQTRITGVTGRGAVKAIGANGYFSLTVCAGVWQSHEMRRKLSAIEGAAPHDADLSREQLMDRAVHASLSLTTLPVAYQATTGSFIINNSSQLFRLSGIARAFGFSASLTDAAPKSLHLSLPSLSEDAYGEIYLRIMCFKDNNATPASPIASAANWRTVWRGGTPTGYTLLASTLVRHAGFVNSLTLPLASPGTDAILWLVILPVHAPLAGDSVAWDIEQTGFDASRVFLLRV